MSVGDLPWRLGLERGNTLEPLGHGRDEPNEVGQLIDRIQDVVSLDSF